MMEVRPTDFFLRCLGLADGVVTSTELNKEIYEKFNKNIYLLPSALDFKIWDSLTPKKSRKLKIGYFGNKEDLEKILPSLAELVKQYPIEFENIAIDGVIDQPDKLAKFGVSMALFPLEDTNYNRSKNNINLLEVMALNIPIVASPIESYKGLPVLYAKTNYEWYECIEKLITDKDFRKDVGQTGYNFVHENYDMKKFVSKFQSWLKELKRKDY